MVVRGGGGVIDSEDIADLGHGYSVELRDISYFAPHGDRPVLANISLTIEPGEFVAVVGENGAGKSSMLAAVAGELPGVTGVVKIGGQSIRKPVNRTIDGVGIVHQFDELDLVSHLSVAQNIAVRQMLGGGHPGLFFATPQSWRRKVAAVLGSHSRLGAENLDDLVSSMAGGKKQMLSVAVAMHIEHQKNPCRLLLLDEHTSRLDHRNAASVMDYTADEIRRTKCTAIMVTHKYEDALKHASRIVVIREGRKAHDCRDVGTLSAEQLVALVEGGAE